MATIKSFTDLSQSKVLANILPIESADMKWYFWKEEIDAPKVPTFGYSKTAAESYKDTEAVYLPCWSLAALLGVIPKKINFGYENDSTFVLKPLENGKYLADYYEFSFVKDNPVDACVAMIEKLHKLNLL